MDGDHTLPQRIVLVVEDNAASLSSLISALEEASITALVARDGLSALDLLNRVTPDLILLDAMMPGIDGFETCRRIKQSPKFALTPVIFLTGLGDSKDMLAGLQAGGVDYVVKPIDQSVLIERIRIHIANADLVEEARAALDVTGPGVFALSHDDRCVWAARRAEEYLGPGFDRLDPEARAGFINWATGLRARATSECAPLSLGAADGRTLEVSLIGRAPNGDVLLKVQERVDVDNSALLARELGLSPREGEVLLWVSKGKSNKDIASILGLSTRTVTSKSSGLSSTTSKQWPLGSASFRSISKPCIGQVTTT